MPSLSEEFFLLTLLLLMPIAGVISLLFLRRPVVCRWVALGASLGTLLLALSLLIPFDWHRGTIYGYARDGGSMQLVQDLKWIGQINVHYKVGVDGLSLPLVFLTAFMMPLIILAGWKIDQHRRYLGLLLLMESALLGVFVSLDLIQFFLLIEVSLGLVVLLIANWNGPHRRFLTKASLGFWVIGSVALLAGIVGIHLYSRQIISNGTFDMIQLASPKLSARLAGAMGGVAGVIAIRLFVLLMAGFLIKMFVLVSRLANAPTPISMLLVSLLITLEAYGILRVAYPIFPHAAERLWLVIAILGLILLIDGAMSAMAETDFKQLISFSILSQIGLFILGTAMMTPAAINGAMFLMIAHGLIGALMLFIVGILHDRVKHGDIPRLGGLAETMPIYSSFSIFALFANLGMPGLCGFVGELLVMLGTFQAARPDSVLYRHASASGQVGWYLISVRILAIVACVSILLTAAYTLRALQRIYFGPPRPGTETLADVRLSELAVLLPLTIMIALLGILPAFFVFGISNTTINGLLRLF